MVRQTPDPAELAPATGRTAPTAPSASVSPTEIIERAASQFGVRRVLVGISGGKDSIATLDLCSRHMAEVRGYFMYLVPGLSFQERYLTYIERKYGIEIIRLPHWGLSGIFRAASFRHPSQRSRSVKVVKAKDVDCYLRQQTGIQWIATGEKAIDSIERNAQIRRCRGINVQRRRIYPLAFWNHAAVYNYLKFRQVLMPPDYKIKADGSSFGSLWARDLIPIRENFPEDYKKILQFFPLAEAQVKRYEFRAAAAVRAAADTPEVPSAEGVE
jgi:phosphoadenosine phosphosulfate reductase